MPVTSHEIYPAAASGADGVEHIRGTSRRGYSPKVSALFKSYQDVVDLLTASKMTITPTIGISGGAFPLQLAKDPSRLDDPRFRTLFPQSVQRQMEQLSKSVAPKDFDAQTEMLKPMGDLVRRVVKGGGVVIAGTDSPIFPYALLYHTELEIFQQSGLTPFEVLQTATVRAAEALGEGANLGSIETGKLADLVVLNDDPLKVSDAQLKRLHSVLTLQAGRIVHGGLV
jgi:imidazolonepropionase-like amidohydrolase